jgi:hypothetical protein
VAERRRETAMLKKISNKKRGRGAFAGKRKLTHAKRRAQASEKEQGAKNYVLERHPELYL